MGSKTIRLDDVYERSRDVRRDDGTDSEAVERPLPGGSVFDQDRRSRARGGSGYRRPTIREVRDVEGEPKVAVRGPGTILDTSVLDVPASHPAALARAEEIEPTDVTARLSSTAVYELYYVVEMADANVVEMADANVVEMADATIDQQRRVDRTIEAYPIVEPDRTSTRERGGSTRRWTERATPSTRTST